MTQRPGWFFVFSIFVQESIIFCSVFAMGISAFLDWCFMRRGKKKVLYYYTYHYHKYISLYIYLFYLRSTWNTWNNNNNNNKNYINTHNLLIIAKIIKKCEQFFLNEIKLITMCVGYVICFFESIFREIEKQLL